MRSLDQEAQESEGRSVKPHYFKQDQADTDDMLLAMSRQQGYVPKTCLLGGQVVWAEVSASRDPCAGCNGPREKCGGRPKQGAAA